MMPPKHTTHRLRRRDPRREGGYVFILVLVLIGIASITAGAALERGSMQSHLAQLQIEGYEEYHELQGAKTLAQLYLFRQDQRDLIEVANTGQPVQSIRFGPETGNMIVNLYVQDGQGTLLRHLGDVIPGGNADRFLRATLDRLPPDRLDVTRTAGAWQVSLAAAPDEVLSAIAGGDEKILRGLVEGRKQQVRRLGDLIRVMNEEGIDSTVVQAIARNLSFAPTMWRIDIEIVRPQERSYFTVLANVGGNLPRLMQWRRLNDPSEIAGFGPLGGHASRSNVASTTSNRRSR